MQADAPASCWCSTSCVQNQPKVVLEEVSGPPSAYILQTSASLTDARDPAL